MLGSWLSGPRSFAEATGTDLGHPGRRLGLPESGSSSVAGLGRRLGATFIDWTIARLIVAGGWPDASPHAEGALLLAVYAVINVALITTVGGGIGGLVLRTRVARLDGANPPLHAVLIRTLLIILVIPALMWDRDYRGLHDRVAGTVVVLR